MKKLNLSMLAMAGLLFASCADKEVVEGGGQGETHSDGYMALNINLPTTPSTRAANDDFDDGDADEYAVNNCALLFFQGDNEDDATLFSVQTFSAFDDDDEDNDNDNITTSYKVVATVKGHTTGNLYVLAALNYDKAIDYNKVDETLKIAGEDISDGTKYSDLRTKTIASTMTTLTESDKGFFMTNAVLSTTPGGKDEPGGNVFQLAKMDPSKIFETKDDALKHPAGDILVERAVAKATLRLATGVNTAAGLSISSTTWVIDNQEPKTYIFRYPGTTADLAYIKYKSTSPTLPQKYWYRFVGDVSTLDNTDFGTDVNYYRTYWCVDPQYSVDAPNMINFTAEDVKYPLGSDNPLYCYENTFDVAHQNYKNTTRAVVKVVTTLNKDIYTDGNFYTINGGASINTVETANSYFITYIIGNEGVKEAIKNSLTSSTSGTSFSIETVDQFKQYFDIDYGYNDKTGVYTVKTVTLKSDISDSPFENSKKETLENALKSAVELANKEYVILQYQEGVMYYEVRFKHFAGNPDLAPWNDDEYGETKPEGGSTEKAYPGDKTTREKNYLGRYGMVRNNWYDLEITSFTGIGYPVFPDFNVDIPGFDGPDTPDDNLKENIAVKIHVLSWAKRTQHWEF